MSQACWVVYYYFPKKLIMDRWMELTSSSLSEKCQISINLSRRLNDLKHFSHFRLLKTLYLYWNIIFFRLVNDIKLHVWLFQIFQHNCVPKFDKKEIYKLIILFIRRFISFILCNYLFYQKYILLHSYLLAPKLIFFFFFVWIVTIRNLTKYTNSY